MPYSALRVANTLIFLAHEADRVITPMQVIKLTYFCHAWMLGLYGRPLLEEPIWAWQYGPVIPEVYQALRHYRGGPVTQQLHDVKLEQFDAESADIIRQVSEKYGKFSGIDLSAMTHAHGTPWHQVWRGVKTIIPDNIIQAHYEALAKRGGNG